MTENTLFINMHDSRCGACGKNADPEESTHDMISMDGEGCGAEFTYVSSHYFHPVLEDHIKELRPDLKWLTPGVAVN